MSTVVHVIDYGLGNLHSVANALKHIGAEVRLAERGSDLAEADHAVLPGVGAFADGMRGLRERGHDDAVRDHVRRGRPLLGICLGMQLLLDTSEEFGFHHGLGIIAGHVGLIDAPGAKVPLVGWHKLCPSRDGAWDGTVLGDTAPGTWAYFVHSYQAQVERPDDRLASIDYHGHTVTAAVGHGAVLGAQFHPEKSGDPGLIMLRRFLTL